jgi:hypothetical protein
MFILQYNAVVVFNNEILIKFVWILNGFDNKKIRGKKIPDLIRLGNFFSLLLTQH